ncbi:MAG TPA: nuclear transport factor 2 family protein [Tepidisphaeraceae bacterium]|jgi:ketosteroid isomerase-like protein
MATTHEVGKQLVGLCKEGQFARAIDALYSPNIVSVEAHANPQTGVARVEGMAAVKAKTDWWEKNHEVHSVEVRGPWPHGDRFIVYFKLDITAKSGPMAGKRFGMEEAGLYTVKDGKVVQEEFFYHMGA